MKHPRQLKIYIAGPYTPVDSDPHDAPRIAYANTRAAIRVGIELIRRGHIPFIPHLTHFIHVESDEPLPAAFYKEYDMVWLRHCDALYFLGPSEGANRELKWATEHGLRIFRALDEIPTLTGRSGERDLSKLS